MIRFIANDYAVRAAVLWVALLGCTNDAVGPPDARAIDAPTPRLAIDAPADACAWPASCSQNAECCGGTQFSCDLCTHQCAGLGSCKGTGMCCTSHAECCSFDCDPCSHTCAGVPFCKADGACCTASSDCCSGFCQQTSGTCQLLTPQDGGM